MAVVQVLNTGNARDTILATCARNIWLIAAMFNIDLIFSHISGRELDNSALCQISQSNTIADFLSRWSMTINPEQKFKTLLHNYKWVDSHLDLTIFSYSI